MLHENSTRHKFNISSIFIAVLLIFCVLALPVLADELAFTILHTSDEHSALTPAPFSEYIPGTRDLSTGGFARLSTLVQNIRAKKAGQPIVLLSSGDFIGGTPFSWLILASHTPELDLMQRIGYTATILGNHEFDYGPDILADYFSAAGNDPEKLSVICSNLVIPEGHGFAKAGIVSDRIIELKNGLKLGIFALLGKGAHRLSITARPLNFSDQNHTARAKVKALRDSGADVIIALTHSGLREDETLAATIDGIDIILGGHDHQITDPAYKVRNTLIMHSGYYLKTAGQLDFVFDRSNRSLRLANKENNTPFIHELDSSISEDPAIAALVEDYLQKLNAYLADLTDGSFKDMRQIIARSEFPLIKHPPFSENAVGNFITDAMRIEAEKLTGRKAHLVFHANGTIRGGIGAPRAGKSGGDISFMDLATVSGLGMGPDKRPGHPLVSLYLTGRELRNMLEIATLLPMMWGDVYFLQVSGIRYHYDPDRAIWFRIPFLNKPLPAYRSVLRAEIFEGTGLQQQDNFREIENDDSKLYNLITTHYLGSYLPMVGQRLPRLNIILKDQHGKPIELDDAIIRKNGREFKIWEAVAMYAASFAGTGDEPSTIPDYYRKVGQRIIKTAGPSLWIWPAVTSALMITIAVLLIFYLRRKKLSVSTVTE